jgi:protein phosphatase
MWRVTRDHTIAGEAYNDGNGHSLAGTHARNAGTLTRALGVQRDLRVDLFQIPLRPGDALLLASDGLTDYVRESYIARVVTSQPPHAAVRELTEAAFRSGGGDNATAVVVHAFPAPSRTAGLGFAEPFGREAMIGRQESLPGVQPVWVPAVKITGGLVGAGAVIALMLSLIVR